jgi:hypothetical protein
MQTPSPAEPAVIRSKNGNWYKRLPNGVVTCRVLHVGPNRSERLRIACLARREKRRAARAAARRPGLLVLDERASNARRLYRAGAIELPTGFAIGVDAADGAVGGTVASYLANVETASKMVDASIAGAYSTGNGHLKA